MAKQFGATDTLLSKAGEDVAKALKKLTGGGPDYAFECVGIGELAATAYRAIRRGGLAVVVGRGEARRLDRGAHHDAAVRGEDPHRQLFRLVRAAHRFSAHARALHGRAGSSSTSSSRGAIRSPRRRRRSPTSNPGRNARGVIVFLMASWPPVTGRILVVDDQRANGEMLAGVLQARGYEVVDRRERRGRARAGARARPRTW